MKIFLSLTLLLLSTNAFAQSIEERLNILTEEVQALKSQGISGNKAKLGGYGEFIYENKRSKLENNTKASHTNNPQADALRFVLYVGYDFDDKWSLFSEIEVEHANEIYLEQGGIRYTASEAFNWQTGVLLIPVGILNQIHEPTTFFSVSRIEIENKIIPTTWREIGTGIHGALGKFHYEIDIVTGLKANSFSSDGVRSGRQKASKAEARDLAWVGRFDYKVLSNFTLGVSAYVGKAGGSAADVKHSIYDFHLVGKFGGLQMQGLYVLSKLDGTTALNNELSKTGSNAVGSELSGYYFDLGYNVLHGLKDWQLIPFARYEAYNTQEKVESGFSKDPSKERTNTVFGFNAKPNDKVVFKADYTIGKNKAKTGYDTWRLGVGWNF